MTGTDKTSRRSQRSLARLTDEHLRQLATLAEEDMRSSQGRAVGRSTSRAAWPSRLHRGLLSTILTAAPA
jgi:hypothetical protein